MESLIRLNISAARVGYEHSIQSTLVISNTGISKYSLLSKNTVYTDFLFYIHFNFCYLKLLISQSKFSGSRKFTLRYQ